MGGATGDDGPSGLTASIPMSVMTLLKNMIGGGIFSLPIGLWCGTPHVGIVILGCIGFLSAVTYWMVGYTCLAWNCGSFRDLWNNALGKRTSWVIDVILFFNSWFTLVTYLVLIGDFTTKSFEGLLSPDHILATNRAVNQWSITLVVLLPLSLKKDLRSLAFTSMLGLVVLLYVIVLVVVDFWRNAPAEWGPDVVLSEWRIGTFEAIAIYTHAFVAHYNAPKMFAEFENPTPSRWFIFVAISYSIAFAVYGTFAWTGFRRFEGAIEGNILRNYEPHFTVLIAWLGMGFSIAFTYPIIFNAMRLAAVGLLALLGKKPGSSSGGELGDGATIVLVLLTAIVATFCTDVGVVNALSGSIFGCLICFVMPALLFFTTVLQQLRLLSRGGLAKPLLKDKKGPRLSGASPNLLRLALLLGIVGMVAGIIFAIIGTFVILSRASASH